MYLNRGSNYNMLVDFCDSPGQPVEKEAEKRNLVVYLCTSHYVYGRLIIVRCVLLINFSISQLLFNLKSWNWSHLKDEALAIMLICKTSKNHCNEFCCPNLVFRFQSFILIVFCPEFYLVSFNFSLFFKIEVTVLWHRECRFNTNALNHLSEKYCNRIECNY